MDSINNELNEILNEHADNSEQEIQLTSAEVLEMMEEVWTNEKFAPEILPNKMEIVDCLLSQIKFMEENLKSFDNSDFKKSIHQLEIDRIKFLITSYLRHRLEKIETYVFSILKKEQERQDNEEELYLSEAELQFARNYKLELEEHIQDVVRFFPIAAPNDWKNQALAPNMHSFVFLQSKNVIEGVVIDDGRDEDGDVVDLYPGSQMVISYNSVANLLKKGDVKLI